MHIFERATKKRLLFAVPGVGTADIHDLWTIDLTKLDAYAVALKKKNDGIATESYIKTVKPKDTDEQLRHAVSVRILEVRVADIDKAKKAVATKAKNQKIMEAIANKKDSALAEASLEDLEKMLEEDSED